LNPLFRGRRQNAAVSRAAGRPANRDVAAIAAVVNGGMRERYPDLYNVWLVDRNRAWAKQIASSRTRHRN
jgi:hypothetical protein